MPTNNPPSRATKKALRRARRKASVLFETERKRRRNKKDYIKRSGGGEFLRLQAEYDSFLGNKEEFINQHTNEIMSAYTPRTATPATEEPPRPVESAMRSMPRPMLTAEHKKRSARVHVSTQHRTHYHRQWNPDSPGYSPQTQHCHPGHDARRLP